MNRALKRTLTAVTISASVGLLMASCSTSNFSSGTAEPSDSSADAIKIGVIVNITGANAGVGVPERDAIDMLAKQFDTDGTTVLGKEVKFIIKDDESTPDGAAKAATQLLEDEKVDLIIGSSTTGPSLAIRSITEEQGIPTISLASNITVVEDSEWIFKTAQNDAVVLERIADDMQAKGFKTVAVVRDSSGFGEGIADRMADLGESHGFEMIGEESFDGTDTDFTAQMTKLKSLNPDAVLLWGLNPAIGLVQKSYVQHNVDRPVYHGHGVANTEFFDKAGSAAEGALSAQGKILLSDQLPADDPQQSVIEAFNQEFQKKYGTQPDAFAGYGHDAVIMAVDALNRAGSTDKRAVRDALEATNNLVGVSGTFTMTPTDHSGLDTSALVIATASTGRWTLAG